MKKSSTKARSTALAGLLATAAATAGGEAGKMAVDGFAARVNDRVITIQEVMQVVAPLDRKLREETGGTSLQAKREEAFEFALETLIQQALILEEFEVLGGQIPDRLIQERANSIIRDQFRNDRTAFEDALIAERLTRDEWREDTKNNLIVTMLRRQEVTDRLKINPLEVYRRYEAQRDSYTTPEQVWLRMATIKGSEETPAATRAAEARGKLLAGAAFAEMAKAFSSDNKAASGGEWGWMSPADLRSELREAIEAATPGQTAPIVSTEDACYLFQVEQRRPAGVKPFEEVRPKIEEELRREESERLFKAWIQRLREKHHVKIF